MGRAAALVTAAAWRSAKSASLLCSEANVWSDPERSAQDNAEFVMHFSDRRYITAVTWLNFMSLLLGITANTLGSQKACRRTRGLLGWVDSPGGAGCHELWGA